MACTPQPDEIALDKITYRTYKSKLCKTMGERERQDKEKDKERDKVKILQQQIDSVNR